MPRDISYPAAPQLGDHSHYAREVLGSVPHWTVRWGTTVIVAAVATLLFVAWWIRYPDTLPAPVTVTSPNPPARIVARGTGKLAQVHVVDQQVVEAGALLAVLEGPADPDAILAVQSQLSGSDPLACRFSAGPTLSLGSVQEAYASYQARCVEYLDYLAQASTAQRLRALEAEQRETAAMLDIQQRQVRTFDERAALSKRDLARLQELRAKRTVAEKDVDDKRAELLDIRRAREEFEADMAATRVNLVRLQRDAVQLATADRERRQLLEALVQEAYQSVLAYLARWEQEFALRAPVAGRVSFFDFWSTSQVVTAGDEVMTIVPDLRENPVGKLRVPLENAGKLAVGQRVHIRLDGYPYEEYGLLQGEVRRISLVPRQRSYAVEVALPSPLVTRNGKPITFMQGMEGQADIITADTRLLQRLLRGLLAPLSETMADGNEESRNDPLQQ